MKLLILLATSFFALSARAQTTDYHPTAITVAGKAVESSITEAHGTTTPQSRIRKSAMLKSVDTTAPSTEDHPDSGIPEVR